MNRRNVIYTLGEMHAQDGYIVSARFGAGVYLRVLKNRFPSWRRIEADSGADLLSDAYLYRSEAAARRALATMAHGARGGLTQINVSHKTRITPIRRLVDAEGRIRVDAWPGILDPASAAPA